MIKNILLFIVAINLISCNQKLNKEYSKIEVQEVNWIKAQNYYAENMAEAILYLDSLKVEGIRRKKTKFYFAQTRESFKKAEAYAAYLNPEVGHKVNGPALPIFKEDSGKTIPPVGLQKLEETIYEDEGTQADFNKEIDIIKGMFANLKNGVEKRPLNPQRFFVSTHQQLMRLVSLAMAGFDTPISGLSISESKVSLESLFYVYDTSIRTIIKTSNPKIDTEFNNNIIRAIKYLQKNKNFISFDQFTFIRDYLNPITRNWVAIRKESKLWEGSKSFPFNFDASTFFEEDSFNADYFAKTNNRFASDKKIALGKKLFFDKNISKNKTMSCATCHNPEKAYADELTFGTDNLGNQLARNTPTLLNSSFQKAFFWDGRSTTLEDQISAVFKNKKEFDTTIHQFSNEILTDTTYSKLFKKAYGTLPTSNREVVKAISSFVATLKSFNSKFDKNIRGEENTFTSNEKRGFNLFMGKALCATCHFMPLTNGTIPPFFNETEKEVIGVPKTKFNKNLDNDYGFYSMFKEDLHKGMFKTPTIRNAVMTAPYMHNGVYSTLNEVINFYAQGGGGGMGFNLPHQTLPFDKLELASQDKNDLIAFIKTLTDIPENNTY